MTVENVHPFSVIAVMAFWTVLMVPMRLIAPALGTVVTVDFALVPS